MHSISSYFSRSIAAISANSDANCNASTKVRIGTTNTLEVIRKTQADLVSSAACARQRPQGLVDARVGDELDGVARLDALKADKVQELH